MFNKDQGRMKNKIDIEAHVQKKGKDLSGVILYKKGEIQQEDVTIHVAGSIGERRIFVLYGETPNAGVYRGRFLSDTEIEGRWTQGTFTSYFSLKENPNIEPTLSLEAESNTSTEEYTPTEGNWRSFWPAFRTAVKTHNRVALKTMMSPQFEYTFGDVPTGDPRDNAFRYWDKPDVRGWIALEKVVAAGVASYKSSDPTSKYPRLIAPPAALGDNSYGWRAVFELGVNGRWRWVAFVSGD